MITRRIARPLSALSSKWVCPNCTRSSFLQQQQKRTLLQVPRLQYDQSFQREGIPGLLTKQGYMLAWTENQGMLVQKLNELLAGEPDEGMDPKAIAVKYARDPMNASLFNHASMAHNNQFFFDGLSMSPLPLEKCPKLVEGLEGTFGSIDTLRTTMLDTASSMFGPGFVWLVWVRPPSDSGSTTFANGTYRILTTYIAGTPYPEAGYRQQGIDMANNNAESAGAYQSSLRPANTVGSFGAYSKPGQASAKYPPGGTQVTPMLCVSTWEHVYMHDYGVGGKRRYLADWWNAVDWHRVQDNMPRDARPLKFQ